MERLLDELSFDAPDRADKSVTIDEAYVDRMLADIVKNEDLSRYILVVSIPNSQTPTITHLGHWTSACALTIDQRS